MPLHQYGVLKGRPIQKRLGMGQSPHYQIHIVDEETDYRIAINVKSKLSPSELLYVVDERFQHPLLAELETQPTGFTLLPSRPGHLALDFIRGNLFDRQDLIPLPHDVPGPDNDLNEKIDAHLSRALRDEDAFVYAFGERWGPEANIRDKYFGFRPGNGIHDIHMNQGNVGRFMEDDGVWQDGALFVRFPNEDQWVAIFLAFQSQSWHTDDETGHTIPMEPEEDPQGLIKIIAAQVNPQGGDVGRETVTLLNPTASQVNLAGWGILDKNEKREELSGLTIESGDTMRVTLSGKGAQLSNKGSIITLIDQKGMKIDGVSYTKKNAERQGWTLVF
ncbi:MAG: hypothetical protein NPIRA01_10130 [Nitrospirales bacterium]|nr:MAG: hypothetical protein NPIRA01_10130 [Nitrospirales bacterium]